MEEVTVEADKIVEEVVVQAIDIKLVMELRVDEPHYLETERVVEAACLRETYFLEITCVALFARIMDSTKFYFSQRAFSSSFNERNRSESRVPLTTSDTLWNRYLTCSCSSSIETVLKLLGNLGFR